MQIGAVKGNCIKDKGKRVQHWYLKDDNTMVKARWNPVNTSCCCKRNGHVTRLCKSPCKRLEEQGTCKETPLYEHGRSDRRYLQHVQEQSRVRVCHDTEMEEAGFSSCSSTSCRTKCERSRKTWNRIQSSVARKGVERNRHEPHD